MRNHRATTLQAHRVQVLRTSTQRACVKNASSFSRPCLDFRPFPRVSSLPLSLSISLPPFSRTVLFKPLARAKTRRRRFYTISCLTLAASRSKKVAIALRFSRMSSSKSRGAVSLARSLRSFLDSYSFSFISLCPAKVSFHAS